MHKKISDFLDSVCANIKYTSAHQDIRDELAIHVDELKNGFMEESQNEETALDMAISAMGDCDEIGKQLNKRHKPETEWSLVGLTAVIAIIGGIVMYISSQFQSHHAVNFERFLLNVALGIAVFICLYFFDYTKLKKFALPLFILAICYNMVLLGLGNAIGGSVRWLVIGGISISSEFTILLLLIAFAGFVDKFHGKGIRGILKLSGIAAISVIPILIQPRLSQAFILLICYAVLILVAVFKKHFGVQRKPQFIFLGVVTACLCGIVFISVLSQPLRMDRFSTFLSRGQSDPLGAGFQQVMADRLLQASSLFGKSTETINGQAIYLFMPEITTDFVLINVFVSLGWVMGVALIAVIIAYITRMFIATKKIRYSYGFYLSLAACTGLSAQFIMGILVNFNLFPPTSVYFPFISYGGTGYIISMALIGLVLSVWRRNNLVSNTPSSKEKDARNRIRYDDGKLIIDLKITKKA